jgi:hypothetical protein
VIDHGPKRVTLVNLILISLEFFLELLTMSLSSKPKKLKRKGTLRELKIVQSIDRRGDDIIKTEEIKTPKHASQKAPSTSRQNHSSSPIKRTKMEAFDSEFLPIDFGGPDLSKKRQTLVFILLLLSTT